MRTAKQKTRQRFLDETARSGTEGEETAASEDTLDPIPTLPDRDERDAGEGVDGVPPSSARTPRTAGSPRTSEVFLTDSASSNCLNIL